MVMHYGQEITTSVGGLSMNNTELAIATVFSLHHPRLKVGLFASRLEGVASIFEICWHAGMLCGGLVFSDTGLPFGKVASAKVVEGPEP